MKLPLWDIQEKSWQTLSSLDRLLIFFIFLQFVNQICHVTKNSIKQTLSGTFIYWKALRTGGMVCVSIPVCNIQSTFLHLHVVRTCSFYH